ncbi:hypothetical protein UlMin_043580 [Ulmus minor]
MASSLEDLLAEDGFKGKKSLSRSRTSFRAESPNLPTYPFPNSLKKDFIAKGRIRTERSNSDASRYSLRGQSPRTSNLTNSRPRDNFVRSEKIGAGPRKEGSNEIFEVGDAENESFKDTYSNEVYGSETSKDKQSNGSKEMKEMRDEKLGSSSKKHMLGRRSLSDNNRKSSSNGKGFEGSWGQKLGKAAFHGVSEPALDEVAIQAIVSILSGYIKRFLKEEDFRVMLRDKCFSSLNVVEREEGQTESRIIAKLEEAIDTIEKAMVESTSTQDLKKVVLQLSVIVGLNSNDLKDGFTSGVPNFKLSACAHLYLSVVYKLQKKDRIAAKHLLQVFCDSPLQARTKLLPELWDYLFFPHLSHLQMWYKKEANSLADTPGRPRKRKLLDKVYNEILDTGTYQFSVYYKDWLTEGVEPPSVPSISIPSVSVREVHRGNSLVHSSELSSPADPFSPKPMVSKKLYDAVFSRSSKPGSEDAEDGRYSGNSENGIRSSDGSAVVKQTLTYSSETANDVDHDIEEDSIKSTQDNPFFPEISENTDMLRSQSHTEENELTLKRLAKSLFEPDSAIDLTVPSFSNSSQSSVTHPLADFNKVRSSSEELHGVYFEEKSSSFSSIPQDFICPLTGQLFDDPVTLETGQTFERAALKAWFDQGKKTCPVTGKALECKVVPFTNLVLKRVIDNWKSEHCRHLLAFASQILGKAEGEGSKNSEETSIFMLEQLLTAFNKEEQINNAKHILSLGGLQFLLQRFKLGNLEEKTRVVALLLSCIEADSSCRNQIARDINKKSLLEILYSKQVNSRTNAVFLLIELICLRRKKDVTGFLSGLQKEREGIESTMHVLLVYLQSSPPAYKPLVAVLLLYLDLLVESRKYSIYREEAVDAITEALELSLTDKKVRENCCRALLILGGRFSFSGKSLTESWILKQAGLNDSRKENPFDEGQDVLLADDKSPMDDEELNNSEWLWNLSASLLGNGKRSFVETISKCIGSRNLDFVRVCLTTVAWLSRSLSTMEDSDLQLPAFSALISQLKESLEHGQELQHKILASMSLLNFSKISECRVLLMSMAEDIKDPLQSLAGVTWTAKLLYSTVSGEAL